MTKNRCRLVLFSLITTALWGCGKKDISPPVAQHRSADAYFQTHFQDESQFIVETILTDIAEMAYFAKNKTLPDPAAFLVEATEQPKSAFRAPVYDVEITLKKKQPPLKFVLPITGPIWSPEAYTNAGALIFDELKLPHGTPYSENDDGAMLADLTDAKATTIETANQSLSAELEHDFLNPVMHEKAAALLSAFAVRENSGFFFDLRSPLCRMTAHLGFAKTLTGSDDFGLSGRVAEAALYTGMGNQRTALEKIKKIESQNSSIIAWQRILRIYNDFDYRTLAKAKDLTQIERIAQFNAEAYSADLNVAFARLTKEDFESTDFLRLANEFDYSVETAHSLLELSLPAEFKEVQEVFQAFHGRELDEKDFVKELNQLPDRCFRAGKKKKVEVRIIGWGQWAMQLQRHVCHAAHQNFRVLNRSFGLPSEANDFAVQSDKKLNGLLLYPFAKRIRCTNEATYHQAVDEAAATLLASPQVVSPTIWKYVWFQVKFASYYFPKPDCYISQWHKHNPPPGTAYQFDARIEHPTLKNQAKLVEILESLHELAPYDLSISQNLISKKYNNAPSYQQLTDIYRACLDYMPGPIVACADAAYNQPEKYEPLLLKVAEIRPSRFWDLSTYFYKRGDTNKTLLYSEKGFELDPDRVRAANNCRWLMLYHFHHGKKDRAKEIADFCGEVYSSSGLCIKAEYHELMEQYDEALVWYEKNAERYNYAGPLIDFCSRYRIKTGDDRFNSAVKNHFKQLFPRGEEKVTLKHFTSAPDEGTLINQDNDLLAEAGLKNGDVIVALNGLRVYDLRQYTYLRDNAKSPQLNLIVWQNGQYREVHASPPNHRFNADFRDYKSK